MGNAWKKKFSHDEMKDFLELKYRQFNVPEFISNDPVSIPHSYTVKQDIEISGFLTAAISWGRRELIVASANRLLDIMGDSPWAFIMEAGDDNIDKVSSFYYRTFNGHDCTTFIRGLKNIYTRYNSMEDVLIKYLADGYSWKESVIGLRTEFFNIPHEKRTLKHFADLSTGAAGKRLNMFTRINKAA